MLLLMALGVGAVHAEEATMGVGEHRTLAEGALPVSGVPDAAGTTAISPSEAAAPQIPSAGLVIQPTFDSSITNNPNSAAIQSMINQAIAKYQALFTDPITVSILFRYASTNADGSPLGGAIAASRFVYYTISWNTYLNALRADAKSSNDVTANASLPSSALSPNILPSSAGGRALGLNTPPAMFSNGSGGGWRPI